MDPDPITTTTTTDPDECPACSSSSSSPWRRSMKRKLDPNRDPTATSDPAVDVSARVGAEDEAAALREAVASAQKTIASLRLEIDEERSAAAGAASEAMAMMLRLQREKADALMESRQYHRFAEEKMALDADEIDNLQNSLAQRESELRHLRHLHHLGIRVPKEESESTYPPLRCNEEDEDDYYYEEEEEGVLSSPLPMQDLERRIYRLENEHEDEDEDEHRGVTMMHPSRSPSPLAHQRRRFYEGGFVDSKYDEELLPELPVLLYEDEDEDRKEGSDRVYIIDDGVGELPAIPVVRFKEYEEEEEENEVVDVEGKGKELEPDVKKLYMRLESLEADRESMRQALVAMRTEKAQLVLLREIAQQLAKNAVAVPAREKKAIVVVLDRAMVHAEKKKRIFSIIALFKV